MMVDLYNPVARQIPIGTYATAPEHVTRTSRTPLDRSNFAAVDAIHTSIPILLRAHAETGQARFSDIAEAHLRRHLEWHVRDDGSTTQLTTFDPATGARRETFSTLASTDAGCWSRGLGWHIAGLANVYAATGDVEVLEALRLSARYYEAHSGRDLVVAWDAAITDPMAPRDSSAAAIAAFGLLQLRPGNRHAALAALGERILAGVLRTCLIRDAAAPNAGAVLHGCYRYPRNIAIDAELVWGDFYVAAALDQLVRPGRGFAA
jgi:unsaturated chondroitin disaccharide hydrolase